MACLCAGAIAGAPPATAESYDASVWGFDRERTLERSPRLLGMGRLTLADDLHNRISLWEFAGNPTGIAAAESVSTLEFRPEVRAITSARDITNIDPVRERENLRTRGFDTFLETWRRSGRTAYGLQAQFAGLQVDEPYDLAVERRNTFKVPAILGTVNAQVPWIKSDRFDYAFRLGLASENHDDRYYEFFLLPQGEYLGRPTGIVPPPDLFTPNRIETSALGGGASLSMRVEKTTRVAIGYDYTRLKLASSLEELRSTSKMDEKQPVHSGQASVVGQIGRQIEWGVDGRAWRSRSEQNFFWSLSAGPTAAPLSGSGKRLDRDQEGTSLDSRARWVSGALALGIGFGTHYRRTIITPWYPTQAGQPAGFNDFLNEVAFRQGADTLKLPERVTPSRVESRGYQVSGGGTWSLADGRGSVGAEYHQWRHEDAETGFASAPRKTGWDVRAGGEYRATQSLRLRGGTGYGIDDRDDRTADNAYRRTVATAGLGYQPGPTGWSMDVGFVYEWVYPDFGDLANTREDRQHLAALIRWPF